eukprot:scaffold263122_cov21-Tisochrysis_lutea.AAC.1
MLRKSSQNFWGLFRGFYASSSSLSSAAPLSHLASQAHAVALSAHQEWTSGSGTNFSFLNNGNSSVAGETLRATINELEALMLLSMPAYSCSGRRGAEFQKGKSYESS